IGDQRAIEEGDRGLGSSYRQRPQASSEPGGQNHCFHGKFYLSTTRSTFHFISTDDSKFFVEDHVLKRLTLPQALLRLNRKITFQDVFRRRHAEQFNSSRDNLLLAFQLDECAERGFIKHHL